MTNNLLKLQWIEKTKVTKFAPGVDPKDPASVPYEVIESSRELSEEEVAKVVQMIEGTKIGEIGQLDGTIARKKEILTKLGEQEKKHGNH